VYSVVNSNVFFSDQIKILFDEDWLNCDACKSSKAQIIIN